MHTFQKCTLLHKSAFVCTKVRSLCTLLFGEQLVMLRVFSHSGGPFSKTAPFHELCSIKIFMLVWKMERAERNARWKFQVYWNSVFNPPGYTVTDRRFEKANRFFQSSHEDEVWRTETVQLFQQVPIQTAWLEASQSPSVQKSSNIYPPWNLQLAPDKIKRTENSKLKWVRRRFSWNHRLLKPFLPKGSVQKVM